MVVFQYVASIRTAHIHEISMHCYLQYTCNVHPTCKHTSQNTSYHSLSTLPPPPPPPPLRAAHWCCRWNMAVTDPGPMWTESYVHSVRVFACLQHTRTHAYMRACMYAHACTHTHTHMHTCMHTHVRACLNACSHVRRRVHTEATRL